MTPETGAELGEYSKLGLGSGIEGLGVELEAKIAIGWALCASTIGDKYAMGNSEKKSRRASIVSILFLPMNIVSSTGTLIRVLSEIIKCLAA
jgi:hypothetical protein